MLQQDISRAVRAALLEDLGDALTALVVLAYGNHYLINVLDAPAAYPAYALGIYGFIKLPKCVSFCLNPHFITSQKTIKLRQSQSSFRTY